MKEKLISFKNYISFLGAVLESYLFPVLDSFRRNILARAHTHTNTQWLPSNKASPPLQTRPATRKQVYLHMYVYMCTCMCISISMGHSIITAVYSFPSPFSCSGLQQELSFSKGSCAVLLLRSFLT